MHYKKALSPTEIIDSAARPQEGPQVVAANMMKTFNKEKAEAETELGNAMEQEEINEAKIIC